VRLRNPFPSFMPTKTGLTHEETASIAGASSESAKVLNDDFDHMARFALEAIVGSMHKNIPSRPGPSDDPFLGCGDLGLHERFASAARVRVRAMETVLRKHIGSISFSARTRPPPRNGFPDVSADFPLYPLLTSVWNLNFSG